MFFHYVRMCAAWSVMHGGAFMVALFFLSDVHGQSQVGDHVSQQGKTIEETIRVHRLGTTKRSIFDAFSYLNRLPEKLDAEETPTDFASRMFSRLANQEGRVLLKMPAGMGRAHYEGLKTFLRYEGEVSVGNCASCHVFPGFTDGMSHVVANNTDATPTPSVRNAIERGVDLKAVLQKKLEASRLKKMGKAKSISDQYSVMQLNAEDVEHLIAFMQILDDVSDEQFRKLILGAAVLDVSGEEP